MNLKHEFSTIIAFVGRTFALVKRYFAWEGVFLFYDVINALTIGLIGLTMGQGNHNETILYLVIGALFWGFMSVLFNEVANSITWERWEGTIEYTFMAPIRRITHLLGMCVFAILYGLVRTMIVLVAVALFFHFSFDQANFVSAIVVMIAASPAFIGLGLIAAVLPLLSPERGTQATHIIQGFILLVSGIYYPVTVLPTWLQYIAYVSPGTYALESARAAILQGASITEMLPNLSILLLIGVILIPVGFVVFRLAEKQAMKTGKLKRSG